MTASRLSDPGRPSLARRWRRLRSDRSGTTSIEAAVVLPLCLLIVFGTMEFANMMWTQNTLSYAVMRAARCAAIKSGTNGACNGSAATTKYAASLAQVDGVTSAAFSTVSGGKTKCLTGSETSAQQVTVTYTYKPLLGHLVPLPTMTLTAMACYPQ